MTMAPWMRGDPMQSKYTFGDALRQFGSALEGIQGQGVMSPEHMQKVFAANPQYAQALYGALNQQAQTDASLQNSQLEREALMDKQRRLQQIRELAPTLAGLDLKDPATRQSALAQYGAITGDLDPMFGVGQQLPAALQEWNAFNGMSQADQARYLQMKRANQIINTGDAQQIVDPTGQTVRSVPIQVSPNELPETKAAQTTAQENAKVQVERQANEPKARQKVISAKQKAKDLRETSRQALEQIGQPRTSGYIGGKLKGVEGTNAYNLAKTVETLKANLGFAELQAMRDASPTGGALGSVAIQELEALQSTIASLEIGQDDEQLAQNIKKVMDHIDNWERTLESGYEDVYQKSATGQSRKPSPEEALRILRERGVVQ